MPVLPRKPFAVIADSDLSKVRSVQGERSQDDAFAITFP